MLRLGRTTRLLAVTAACAATLAAAQAPAPGESTGTPAAAGAKPGAHSEPRPPLDEAPAAERQTIDRLLRGGSWARRAVAIMRLERYGCAQSRRLLLNAQRDPSWQVRNFAIRALARRGEALDAETLAAEDEPRVVRTALRYRAPMDLQRIARGSRVLARSSDLHDKMLAVELAAATEDEELRTLARDTAKQVILRMDRGETGMFAARLGLITGQRRLYRPYQWKDWALKAGRRFEVHPGHALPPDAGPQPPSLIAELESESFVGVEEYMNALGQRELDLAILLDCTASMSGELAAAQGGVDDLMLFVSDLVASARIAIVGYRDRRDEFETRLWDFTSDLAQARTNLWTLTAAGGGDEPEAVQPAMKAAFTQLTWRTSSAKVLVLVGDAPPHVGFGGSCVEMARRAREEAEVATHTIQAKGKDVKFFPEIAEAGGGRCVSLDDDDALIAEIAGLTLRERYEQEFREFFKVYLELCR